MTSSQLLGAVLAIVAHAYGSSITPDVNSILGEWCAWCLVWLGCRTVRAALRPVTSALHPESSRVHDVLAVLAISVFISQRQHSVEWIVPLLGPLVVVFIAVYRTTYGSDGFPAFTKECMSHGVLFYLLATAGSWLLFQQMGDAILNVAASAHLIAMTMIFTILYQIQLSDGDTRVAWTLEIIALRVVALLTVAALLSQREILQPSTFLPLVISRSAFWIGLLTLVSSGQPVAAASLYSFGVQVIHLRAFPFDIGTILLCIVCAWTIWNKASEIRNLVSSRLLLLGLIALPILAIRFGTYLDVDSYKPLATPWRSYLPTHRLSEHPVTQLAREAAVQAAALWNEQSISLDQAATRYRQLHNREPPPGFDQWFNYVKEHDAMTDAYMTITKSFDPFFALLPAQVREHVGSAVKADNSHLALISIQNGTVSAGKEKFSWISSGVAEWLDPLPDFIPDMEFVLNLLDEPRVILPHDQLESMKQGSGHVRVSRQPHHQDVGFIDLSKRKTWDWAIQSCPLSSRSRSGNASPPQVLFTRNITEAIDTCQNPYFKSLHGFYLSPDTAIFTRHAVPIFSQTKPSSFQDILYPSPLYQRSYDLNDYVDGEDSPWYRKSDQLYWSGSSTGGYTQSLEWRKSHRQRFAEMCLQPDALVPFLSQDKDCEWTSAPFSRVSQFFKVKLSAAVQCSVLSCFEQKQHFRILSRPESMSEAYKAKLVMDLDGNSFSGRFYRLLGSRSLVLKQTIFQEWHDDRLVPWAHYIPISLSMAELPETVRYLLETEEGKVLSRKIAAESREWTRKVLRGIDLKVAFYRSLIEFAWLVSSERKA